MAFKFYACVAKELKLTDSQEVLELIATFVEVTEENW